MAMQEMPEDVVFRLAWVPSKSARGIKAFEQALIQ
jgi:hypothetical protein